ncbi:MAG TPA: hypothetical protein VIN60_02865 [Anaerolineales bacterium]
MSNMMKFHKLLSASSEDQGPYWQAMKAFTMISPAQLMSITDGLGWVSW